MTLSELYKIADYKDSKGMLFNGDCLEYLKKMEDNSIDLIITSPPYNLGKFHHTNNHHFQAYSEYDDNMPEELYQKWQVEILNENGCVLWNVSYGSDATVNTEAIGLMWLSIADIIRQTNFTVADRIVWKKASALPNNVSKNKLTRTVEDVFVFCRKGEYKTFNCNKEVSSIGKNGQTFYKNTFNFIEAKNNDGSCKLNKATYSSDLCKQLL